MLKNLIRGLIVISVSSLAILTSSNIASAQHNLTETCYLWTRNDNGGVRGQCRNDAGAMIDAEIDLNHHIGVENGQMYLMTNPEATQFTVGNVRDNCTECHIIQHRADGTVFTCICEARTYFNHHSGGLQHGHGSAHQPAYSHRWPRNDTRVRISNFFWNENGHIRRIPNERLHEFRHW